MGAEEDNRYHVEGNILLEYGSPATDFEVRLYSKGFGKTELKLGESKTDKQGHFEITYEPKIKPTNIELRIADRGGNEIPLSGSKFNPNNKEVLNLVAPARVQPLAPEYERLVGDLQQHLGGSIERLGDAQEKRERRDLSLLHNSSGWDARLIALLAKASKLSIETGISLDVLYAFCRVGLPSDKLLLARVDVILVEKALEKAKNAGIISPDVSTENARRDFQKFSRSVIRDQKAPGTLSSLQEILDKSVLDKNNRKKFEDLYFDHRGSGEELWKKAAESGIPREKIQGLRLQGKLSYLSLNNADLTEKLQQEIGSMDSISKLVDLDLYSEVAWEARLESMAGTEELMEKIIPPAYKGEKTADRKSAYAADLARKVRLSFPTKTVARLMEKGDLNLGPGYDNEAVVTFLKRSERIGL